MVGKFQSYLERHGDYVDLELEIALEKVLLSIETRIDSNARIYTIGNGGSHATAEHFAADLNLTFQRVGKQLNAVCVTSMIATHTALSNDFSYNLAIAKYLEGALRDQDLVVVFTASGNSENILEAVALATSKHVDGAVFSGFDGGKVLQNRDVTHIHTPTPDKAYGEVENLHMAMCHFIIDGITLVGKN